MSAPKLHWTKKPGADKIRALIKAKLKGRKTWNKGLKGYNAGDKHYHWKGGKINDSYGYILIYSPEHPFKDKHGYVREHRLVMEKHLGRYLTKEEIVHHKNEDRSDNRLKNLELMGSQSEHVNKHHKGFVKFRWNKQK